jgi:hypothetical protein
MKAISTNMNPSPIARKYAPARRRSARGAASSLRAKASGSRIRTALPRPPAPEWPPAADSPTQQRQSAPFAQGDQLWQRPPAEK